jgi:adenylosuccinate synthase
MPNIAVVGAQWGDEGKGKVVDLLTEKVQVVARYNGGHNAGHTVIVDGQRFVLRLIPCGILHPGILCVIGNGMVIDPWELEREMEELRARGLAVEDNLVLSERAHLILPYHGHLERMAEESRGQAKIGTTLRGIGPAYEDKAARRGLRLVDLLRPEKLAGRLTEARGHYERLCRGYGVAPTVDFEKLHDDLVAFGARLGPHLRDTAQVLHQQMASGYSILLEGAQATLLDIDHGSYPFVTSSSATIGGAVTGLGIPPSAIDGVLGIAKAYTTRVGAGPLPSEIGGALEEKIRERGGEYGANTGRPRRCGWFDGVVTRYAARLNGFDSLAITKLDVLDQLDEVKICTGYSLDGQVMTDLPSDPETFERCRPVYETMPGWSAPTGGIREYKLLPEAARRYLERLSEVVACEIGIVSTGPDRLETVFRGSSRIAAWFE